MGGSVVRLNVYAVEHGALSDALLAALGLGQHQSGVQVCENEYTFTSAGIVKGKPLQVAHALSTAIFLGRIAAQAHAQDAGLGRGGMRHSDRR